jgi:hypothetical protein
MKRYEALPVSVGADWLVAISMDGGGAALLIEDRAVRVADEVSALLAAAQEAVEAERKRVVEHLRSRAADNWDPSSEASLQRVAEEIARDHHHGGR